MKKLVMTILCALVGGVLITACGTESVDTAKTNYCNSLVALGQSIQTWQGLTISSTVDDVQNAKKGVEDSWQKTADSAKSYKEAQQDALQTAFQETEKTMKDVSSQDTIAQVLSSTAQSMVGLKQQTESIMNTSCVGVVTPVK